MTGLPAGRKSRPSTARRMTRLPQRRGVEIATGIATGRLGTEDGLGGMDRAGSAQKPNEIALDGTLKGTWCDR